MATLVELSFTTVTTITPIAMLYTCTAYVTQIKRQSHKPLATPKLESRKAIVLNSKRAEMANKAKANTN
jgi:hypothetical protein